MSLLNRATSGARQNNRLLAMEGKGSATRLATTPSQGATGVTAGQRQAAGRGHTMLDQYFHGIDHEWSRRTGQPLTHSHSRVRGTASNGRRTRRLL